MFILASASGNTFAYAQTLPGDLDGPAWARALGRLKLDGLFLVPGPGRPWVLEHWDADGGSTFCSNGTRASLALPWAPQGDRVAVISNGQAVDLRRDGDDVAIRMPEGPGTGFLSLPPDLEAAVGHAHAYGWIGNPQLVLEGPDPDTLDLGALARPLRHHPALEGGTNINVIRVLEPGLARIRSWERGVEGETLCCGTGCAVAGAWLARRTGIGRWRMLPEGEPLTVTAELDGDRWRELWVAGPVRRLGTFAPDR